MDKHLYIEGWSTIKERFIELWYDKTFEEPKDFIDFLERRSKLVESSKEEILLRRISELEKEVQDLEGQLRFEKAKNLEIKPKTYSFWHESDNLPRNTNTTYPPLFLYNQQLDFIDTKEY